MKFLADPRFIRFATAAFWICLGGAFVMAVLPKPPYTPIDQYGDKFAHIVAFTSLTVLALLAYGRVARWRILERLCFFGAVIEVIQSIPALHRQCDVRDWAADTLAVLVVIVVLSPFLPRRESGAR
jgi:VanZ family protein